MPSSGETSTTRHFSASGVVLMKGHPHHPMLHHHGLGDLAVAEGSVRLCDHDGGQELAVAPADRLVLGTSTTLNEFGSILFVDFGDDSVPVHERQWAVDFALVDDIQRVLRSDGAVDHERLVEYQVSLTDDDVRSGIRLRSRFVDTVTALGGRYEDESTSFEHLIAKWPF